MFIYFNILFILATRDRIIYRNTGKNWLYYWIEKFWTMYVILKINPIHRKYFSFTPNLIV